MCYVTIFYGLVITDLIIDFSNFDCLAQTEVVGFSVGLLFKVANLYAAQICNFLSIRFKTTPIGTQVVKTKRPTLGNAMRGEVTRVLG